MAAGAGLAALAVVLTLPGPQALATSYDATSTMLAALGAGAALACAAAGALVARRHALTGALLCAAGVLWWAPEIVGLPRAAPLVRSLAALAAPLLAPVLVHVALAAPHGRVPSRLARRALAALYAAAGLVALAIALLRDPFADPECWRTCTVNALLVHSAPGAARALVTSAWLLSAAAGLTLVALGGRALARPRGRILALAHVTLGAATTATAVVLVAGPPEDPQRAGFAALFAARALALAGLAGALAWMTLDARRRQAAVARLAEALGDAPAPGTLEAGLARSLGDPGLRVGFWLAGERRHVDAEGRDVTLPAPGGGRVATRLERAGEPVAVVVHDAALLDGDALGREIGAAARLAVDNERLQAAVRARNGDLQASRARIVATGDAARRRLERDLHDGAQQRLLAVSYELRLARAAAARTDAALAAGLDGAVAETDALLTELRDLAHGIFPAILGEAGLAAALESLADVAPLPLELGALPEDPLPPAVATAAYLAVSRAVEDAARTRSTHSTPSASTVRWLAPRRAASSTARLTAR